MLFEHTTKVVSLRKKQEENKNDNSKKFRGEILIIPVRCLSCGKPVGHLYEEYLERTEKGEDKAKVMTELGLSRYCCRGLFLGHVDLIDTIAQFKKA